MQLLDGAAVSAHIREQIRSEALAMQAGGQRAPHLAAVLVGDDAASQVYVGSKVRTCEELGFGSTLLRLDAGISEEALLETVRALNENPEIDGILVQLPLPKHISSDAIINAIAPEKDVDGFHPISQGRMVLGQPTF